MNKKRMLFKLGVTVIILTAWYMYYAINKLNEEEKAEVNSAYPDGIKDNFDPIHENLPDSSENQQKEWDIHEKDERSYRGLQTSKLRNETDHWRSAIHLAVVSCGDRMQESLEVFKSAVLFSSAKLVFHIFTETESREAFKNQLDFWPPSYRARVEYHIYNLSFPAVENARDDWQKLFKPCAAQRLFIPALLQDVDALLYVDTDILFLSPVDKIWDLFAHFNTTQLAGLSPEHEDKQTGWYNRFARHPFYGELGVNSGVMLMNLTRLRASSWLQSLKNFYKEYRLKIAWGDQDLINIYFHYHPDQLYVFPCEWNYRPDHCMYMSVCLGAEQKGVHVLHGARRVWHNDKQPAFRAIYNTFKQHRLGASIQYDLLENLQRAISGSTSSNCGKLQDVFTRQIQEYVHTADTNKR